MEPIVFSAQMSETEFVTYLKRVTRKGWMHKLIIAFGIIMALTVFANLLLGLKMNDGDFPVFQTLFALYALIFYPIIINRSAKTGYKKNKFFHEKITYTIDESGIEWQGETMWEKKTWSEIEKIGFLDKLLLLSILNSVWTHYIPIDSLDEEELLRLKKILARVNINQVQL
jgi:hypothetical protein